ncbi:uncharacterized protein IUM83_05455 [Phytophthora cinnamomi]|uniref:uncharacterized protein n=1 Tax=Phytophthora cinnamomi TaxID=4785 RepID=UPI00355A9E03|nr:hypothetical protein IUM83_05455 [Phytophthora cinnamomi]
MVTVVSPVAAPVAGMSPLAPARSASPLARQISTPRLVLLRRPARAPSDLDSEFGEEGERMWEAIVRDSQQPDFAVSSPVPSGPASSPLASPSESPVIPGGAVVAVPAASGGLSPVSRLQELIFELEVEGWSGDEMTAAATSEDGSASTAEPVADDQASPEAGTGLFDDSDDEEDRLTKQRSRLRRGDETSSWHPPLPPAPDRHPSSNQKNHYDPTAPWDYSKIVDIVRLLDSHGDPPHRCYLVQWKGRPLQLSWVGMEQLDKPWLRRMMDLVDTWKRVGSSKPLMRWAKERDEASEAGTCFMDAFRSALYYLGQPDLVTMAMWDAFEDTRPSSIQFGVSREDVTEFFKLLQRQSVPLNYDHLLQNVLSSSSANVATLCDFCRDLPAGVYMVSAGQDGLGHCFVLVKRRPDSRVIDLDNFKAGTDPPMDVLPLSDQLWIQHVKWMTRVELKPGYKCRHGKRKSKTQRKRE